SLTLLEVSGFGDAAVAGRELQRARFVGPSAHCGLATKRDRGDLHVRSLASVHSGHRAAVRPPILTPQMRDLRSIATRRRAQRDPPQLDADQPDGDPATAVVLVRRIQLEPVVTAVRDQEPAVLERDDVEFDAAILVATYAYHRHQMADDRRGGTRRTPD